MARVNDISSTEKLLDLIRKKGGDSHPAIPPPEKRRSFLPPLKKGAKRSFSFRIASSQKAINVGVDIGHDSLRMVKMIKASDNQWTLTDYERAPLSGQIRRATPEFINFVKTEVTRFCGSQRKINIWAIMSAANVNVRHIRIPKIAKSQLENAVFWTIKKETPFNEKETVLDFEILDEIVEEGVPKWLVMAYTAPAREVQELSNLFAKAGLPLTGISIVPFAIQNIFRTGWVKVDEGNVASLFIGNDFSRIDIYVKGNLVMTRGIKAGINSMIESLLEVLQARDREASGAEPGTASSISLQQARKVLFSLSPDSEPLKEGDAGFELTEEMKFEIIEPALNRLVRQVERTFEYYMTNVGHEKIPKLFVTSVMNVHAPMIAYVGEQLGIQSGILDHFRPDSSRFNEDGRSISLSEKMALLPALGMALSDNAHTPNLLFTSKDKQKVMKVARINRAAIAIFMAAVMASAGIFLYELGIIEKKKGDIAGLRKQLAQYQPRIDKQEILQMAARAKTQKFSSGAYSERYRGMAVIGELSAITPANVRLISLKTEFGMVQAEKVRPTEPPPASTPAPAEKKEAAKEQPKEAPKEAAAAGKAADVVLEGFIFGNRRTLEAALAEYLMKLQSSPVFRQVTVQRNNIDRFQKKDILRFTINMKVA